jgi:hypothetical protein
MAEHYGQNELPEFFTIDAGKLSLLSAHLAQ